MQVLSDITCRVPRDQSPDKPLESGKVAIVKRQDKPFHLTTALASSFPETKTFTL